VSEAIGTTLKRGLRHIAQVQDISGPDLSTDTDEITNHDSPDGVEEFIPTTKRTGEMAFPLVFLPSDHSHDNDTGLLAAWADRSLDSYVLTYPDSSTWTSPRTSPGPPTARRSTGTSRRISRSARRAPRSSHPQHPDGHEGDGAAAPRGRRCRPRPVGPHRLSARGELAGVHRVAGLCPTGTVRADGGRRPIARLMALMANLERDPKRRLTPWAPEDFLLVQGPVPEVDQADLRPRIDAAMAAFVGVRATARSGTRGRP
jgi:hypothetical protein